VTNTPDEKSTAPDEKSTAPDEVDPVEQSEESTKAAEATDEAEGAAAENEPAVVDATKTRKNIDWARFVAYAALPALALILALVAGSLKFIDSSAGDADNARAESLQAAKAGTIALLSYQPDTVEQQLTDARKLLTGEFLTSYTSLTNDVVIPGATQKRISAVAAVPSAASVSADQEHAVVLVFVNQTVVVGQDTPTSTASSVRLTMEKIGDKWLISKFEPV
jgi:Mce-associated membrane protein